MIILQPGFFFRLIILIFLLTLLNSFSYSPSCLVSKCLSTKFEPLNFLSQIKHGQILFVFFFSNFLIILSYILSLCFFITSLKNCIRKLLRRLALQIVYEILRLFVGILLPGRNFHIQILFIYLCLKNFYHPIPFLNVITHIWSLTCVRLNIRVHKNSNIRVLFLDIIARILCDLLYLDV